MGRASLRQLASYDCFPEFSAWVRRTLYHPLGVLGCAAAVAALCGAVLHAQGFVLAGGLLLVMLLGIAWPWLTLRGVQAELHFESDRGTEGETLGVRVVLRNRGWWPAIGLTLHGGFGTRTEPVAAIGYVPRRQTVVCRWAFVSEHRGVYPLGPVTLATGFPFGLWETRRRVRLAGTLLVWPRVYPVGPVPPVGGTRQVEGNVARNKVGTSGDIMGVRPYRRGDSPRRIHWAQSARHDRLIVCELQTNARPILQLVLDTDTHTQSPATLEWAIRIVASFAHGWLAEGAQIGVAWAGGELHPASGGAQQQRILDALAAVQPTTTPLDHVLACPTCHRFRDGLQIIVTTARAAHHACATCVAEDERWVILALDPPHEHADSHPAHPPAWLTIDDVAALPTQLLGAWREAQHGS